MRNINVSRTIPASRQSVWNVLADFPSISVWNGGVKNSFSTSESSQGVGAQRHCDLAPVGQLEETITEWKDQEVMTVSIDSAKMLPLKKGLVTFALSGPDDATTVDVSYDYWGKPAFMEKILGGVLDSQLSKGFTGFLEDLEKAAVS